jgi:acyl-CoA thioesterase-1
MSDRISSVPVESVTALKTCSTEIIESDMEFSLIRRHFSLLLLSPLIAGPSFAQVAKPTRREGTLLVLGDSLSAEYGLQRGEGWAALLQARLAQEKIDAHVVNASISGDTTSGGRSRLPALLALHKPTLVVIELGGNDALRGLPLAMSQDNLQNMVQAAKAAGAKVLLLGMEVPPNYGRAYAKQFADMFTRVAKDKQVPLVPFLLKGVADGPDALKLFQADRIHPLAAAHPTILNNVWPALKKLLP